MTPSLGLCLGTDVEVRVLGPPRLSGQGGGALLGPGRENPEGTHIAGQLFVVFHEALILLVDGQHLADAIGGCLGLATRQRGTQSASRQRERLAHACGDDVSPRPCRSRGWKAPPKTLNSQAPRHPLCQPRPSPTDQVSPDRDLSG